MRCWAVIPAAGVGRRMGAGVPKQYLEIRGRTVIEHTVTTLITHRGIAGVVVVVSADDDRWASVRTRIADPASALRDAIGGAERFHSVLNGLERLADVAGPDDWALVHDAARPCLTHAELARLIDALADHPVGGLLALPVGDTLKRAGAEDAVVETVDRDRLWRALTPQMFPYRRLREALSRCLGSGAVVTDECQAMERFDAAAAQSGPRLVPGYPTNIKITHPEDLELARLFLSGS